MSKVSLICDYCGGDLQKYPSQVHDKNFCNEDCRKGWERGKRVQFECTYCGSHDEKLQSLITDSPFCDEDCYYMWVSDNGRVEVSCEKCGELKTILKSSETENNFCGRDCHLEWMRGLSGEEHPNFDSIEVECEWCGSKLIRQPNEIEKNDRNFCRTTESNCYQKWRSEYIRGENHGSWSGGKVQKDCEYCGSIVERHPSQFSGDKSFCSDTDCYARWQSENRMGRNHHLWEEGGKPYYGPNWDDVRSSILERDGYRCVRCDMTCDSHIFEYNENLHVHHIVPLRNFSGDFKSANEESNLVSLCTNCHHKMEWLSPDEQKEILFDREEI